MAVDAYLIIITSNSTPGYLADSTGMDNRDAIYRRFVDTCGTWFRKGYHIKYCWPSGANLTLNLIHIIIDIPAVLTNQGVR